jgi:hypothetical protein
MDMMSLRPPYAPTGRPPPMTLPRVVTSGVTPKYSCGRGREGGREGGRTGGRGGCVHMQTRGKERDDRSNSSWLEEKRESTEARTTPL